MNLNFYEKLFLGIFSSLSRTNKSIPEWSTIFCISILIFVNFVSFLKLVNSNFNDFENGTLQVGIILLITLNWFYFLKNGRILKKLKKVKYHLKKIEKIIIGIYSLCSILLLFYILEMGTELTMIFFGGILVLMFLVYEFGEKPIDFK